MELSEDGAQDGEVPEDVGWNEGVAADADAERAWESRWSVGRSVSLALMGERDDGSSSTTIASFIEAVCGITMVRVDGHLVTSIL